MKYKFTVEKLHNYVKVLNEQNVEVALIPKQDAEFQINEGWLIWVDDKTVKRTGL